MSDREIAEAIANGREALRDCVAVFRESGRKVSKPGIEAAQWLQRLPQTLYSKLTMRAENEGVSINSYVTCIRGYPGIPLNSRRPLLWKGDGR